MIYLFTRQRAEELAKWVPKGKLHRIGTWEPSGWTEPMVQGWIAELEAAPSGGGAE